MPRDLSDYVAVNERIVRFIEKYPDGCLQSEIDPMLTSADRIAIVGYAYRTPDDPKPGMGRSWIEVPGKTPYTRGSELENAETSAWGRALASLGFEVKRGIASRDEVEAKDEGDEVTVTDSSAPRVARGGRSILANEAQLRSISKLSLDLKLGLDGVADAVKVAIGREDAPTQKAGATSADMVEYLTGLSADELGEIVTYLEDTKVDQEALAEIAAEVEPPVVNSDDGLPY